jgi:hypothetical protein
MFGSSQFTPSIKMDLCGEFGGTLAHLLPSSMQSVCASQFPDCTGCGHASETGEVCAWIQSTFPCADDSDESEPYGGCNPLSLDEMGVNTARSAAGAACIAMGNPNLCALCSSRYPHVKHPLPSALPSVPQRPFRSVAADDDNDDASCYCMSLPATASSLATVGVPRCPRRPMNSWKMIGSPPWPLMSHTFDFNNMCSASAVSSAAYTVSKSITASNNMDDFSPAGAVVQPSGESGPVQHPHPHAFAHLFRQG